MTSKKLTFAFVAMTLVVGCNFVRDAREAQLAADRKANGETAQPDRITLAGYTLQQLVGYALTNAPSMSAARLAVEDSRLALKSIAADAPLVSKTPWTAISASANLGHSEKSVASKLDDFKWDTDGKASGGISLDLLIWDFGRNNALAKAQVENVIAAELALVRQGYDVFENVASSYFTLLEKDALLEVAFTNRSECIIQLDRAETMLNAGEAQELDVLRAKLNLAQAEERIVSASNAVVTAGAELVNCLGIESTRSSRDEIMPLQKALSVVRRGFGETDDTLSELYALAETNSPVLLIAKAKVRAAKYDVDYAIADLMPRISTSVGLDWTNPMWLWRWSVSASQPIFQGFRKKTAVERATVRLKTASSDLDDAVQALQLSLELAIAERDNAAKARETAESSLFEARKNFEIVKKQYEVGDVSRVEFSDSLSSLTLALGNRVSAFYAAQRAEAKLFALVGRLPVYDERILEEDK